MIAVMGREFSGEDAARDYVDSQHIGPFIIGETSDVEVDKLAMSFYDAMYEIDCQVSR